MLLKISALLAVALITVTGCVHYGSYELQGVSTDDIDRRISEAYKDTGLSRRNPPNCAIILESIYKGRRDIPWGITNATRDTWDACLDELELIERNGEVKRREYLAKQETQRQAREREKQERRQRKLEKLGPDFLDLYVLAQTKGAKAANDRLDKYGKSLIHSELEIQGCSGNICRAGFPQVWLTRGMRALTILVRGIYSEPGQSLSSFRLVRFDQYGYGSSREPIAVFTYK